eukprot:1159940-Rhodomonas_salina.2
MQDDPNPEQGMQRPPQSPMYIAALSMPSMPRWPEGWFLEIGFSKKAELGWLEGAEFGLAIYSLLVLSDEGIPTKTLQTVKVSAAIKCQKQPSQYNIVNGSSSKASNSLGNDAHKCEAFALTAKIQTGPSRNTEKLE